MNELYYLMHKDVVCGALYIDVGSSEIRQFASHDKDHVPYLGNGTPDNIKRWWKTRSVPASRKSMQEIIRNAGCTSSEEYLTKNLALSMTDCYWICPADISISWKDVNLFDNAHMVNDGLVPYHNATSYDPNASLGGQMNKYWDCSKATPELVKIAYQQYGQQAINEIFATRLHARQSSVISYVTYTGAHTDDNGIGCFCDAFTNEGKEFIPALEVIDSRKNRNDISLYDQFISICAEHGADKGMMQDYMDYQTMTDFILSNTDEHLLNFGAVRNPDTLKFISPAPIFDSGNSMFYTDTRTKPYSRTEMLERKITSFHDKEELILKHVRDKSLVKFDLLPSPSEAMEFYAEHGIPENKAKFISENYKTKLVMFKEFQLGKTISLYNEKRRERSSNTKALDEDICVREKIAAAIKHIEATANGVKDFSPNLSAKLLSSKEPFEKMMQEGRLTEEILRKRIESFANNLSGKDSAIKDLAADALNNALREDRDSHGGPVL